ncbi:MAG TPA: GlcNAc-transferase family protein [Ramlibacter sp.]|uniref:GlcNAc-transferase family protein n=1 Tax=Ramlibacter sp. TaxID=1917967 RepID=UPI002D082752|nr:GlcNAc-transferase family protein [Ramlibacter sp.]HVZ47131.1 GlcNAc-transferase family protein [Ramlibacter sp.]
MQQRNSVVSFVSIFVSIASYCDPVLRFTLERALALASDPDGVHFGVVDQSPAASPRLAMQGGGSRLALVRIDPVDARGPCWARAIGMGLYDGEDWFFQIDSHMDFDEGWDALLIAQARELLPHRRGVVISAYPHPFVFEDGKPVHKAITRGVLAHVVRGDSSFQEGHPVLAFTAYPVEGTVPLAGFHLGAGCLFAPGQFVQEFPYDPFLYFHGEEQALALRIFTHGWDIFHMARLPVYHLYNMSDGAPEHEKRPLHWDEGEDARRGVKWWTLEQRSRARLQALVNGEPLGAYGLGSVRSLADYAAFSGIDYAARTIADKARLPLAADGAV